MLISRRRRLGTGGGGGASVADHLAYTTQPVGSTSPNLATQPVVAAKKADGSTDTTYVGTVALTLNVLTGSATLGGTTSVALSSGVATFTNVTVTSAAGATWTLTAALAGLASATSSTGTTTAGGFVTITDSFTAADGTNLAGRTTDTGGKVWTSVVGTFQILSNQAAPNSTSGGDIIVFDAGVSDATFGFTVGTGSSTYSSLVFRYSDASNYWLLWRDGTSAYLSTIIAGVRTERRTIAASPVAGDTFAVRCSGTSYQIVINGVDTGSSLTFTHNTTATKTGFTIMAGNAGARWDNFSVTVP